MRQSINRRRFLAGVGAGLSAVALPSFPSTCAAGATGTKPNVLVLFTDDQRFNTIRALGNGHIHTPAMDSIVRRGTTFTNAHIMGAMNGAVCMPSRAMLMTGRHLFNLERDGRTVPDEHNLMPESFRKAGYRTFATGKQHNGKRAFHWSFTDGARIFFGGMSDHYKVPVRDFDSSGEYPNDRLYHVEGRHSSTLFADAAVDFLRGDDDDRPFFAYVSFTAPHDPRDMPQRFLDMYDPDELPIPPNFLPEHPFDNGDLRIRDEALAPWPRTHAEVRKHLAAYYAMITHVDSEIGRVLDALEESGRADNTIIVLAGDNGLAVGCHGLMGKQNMYDHSVHVPLVLAGPGIPSGEKRDALCYLYDLYPTLCDLAGLPAPETADGESLAPVIADSRKKVRESVFHAYKNFQRAVRNDRWKLIRYNVKGEHHVQLFDLAHDPHETMNLADEPSYASRVNEMTGVMKEWLANTGDAVDLGKDDWGVPEIPSWGTKR